jgi:hypothetical protein
MSCLSSENLKEEKDFSLHLSRYAHSGRTAHLFGELVHLGVNWRGFTAESIAALDLLPALGTDFLMT